MRNEIIRSTVNNLAQSAGDAKEAIQAAMENLAATIQGTPGVSFYAPGGYRYDKVDGLGIIPTGRSFSAKPPFHVLTSLDTLQGNPVMVPAPGKDHLTIDGTEIYGGSRKITLSPNEDGSPEEGDRPLVVFTAMPVAIGHNTYVDLQLRMGKWRPNLFANIPIELTGPTVAISLTKRHQVTNQVLGLKDGQGQEIEIDTANLTAGPLIEGIGRWIGQQTDGTNTLANTHKIITALEVMAELSPHWKSFWTKVNAREALGALMVIDDSAMAFAAALETMISVPEENRDAFNEVQKRIHIISKAIRDGRISGWRDYANLVQETFQGFDESIALNVGVNPTLALLDHLTGQTATRGELATAAVRKAFGKNANKPLAMSLNGDPVTLLVADPTALATIVDAFAIQWPLVVKKIIENRVGAVTAGLHAERLMAQTQSTAMKAYAESLQKRSGRVIMAAKRAGNTSAQQMAGAMKELVDDMLAAAVNTKREQLEEENKK